MELLHIPAHEIELGDIIGEGMEVWFIVRDYGLRKRVTICWGPKGACLVQGKYRDKEHTVVYDFDQPIKVLRR